MEGVYSMYGIMLTGDTTAFQLDTILQSATTVLTWMLTSLGSILTFFVNNPGLLVWLVASVCGLAFVYFRKLF